MDKIRRLLAFVIILTICVTGCGRGPQLRIPQNDGKERHKIAISIAGTANDNYRILKDEITKTAKSENMEIVWMEAQNSILKQDDDLKKAASQDVKVLIIEPVDPDVPNAGLAELQAKGIKVIYIGSLPKDVAADGFIAPDFQKAGLLQANQLLKETEGIEPLNILVLCGDEGSRAADRILDGSRAVLREGERINKIWWVELESTDTGKAYDAAKSYLSGAVKPQAIAAHSPELNAGIIKAVEDTKNSGKVKVFGMGTEMSAIEAMKKGVQTGDIDLMPEMLARVIFDTAENLIEDEPWPYEEQLNNGTQIVPAKFTPIRAITKANISLLKEREQTLKKGGGGNNESNQEKSNSEGGQKAGESGNESKNQGEEKKSTLKVKTKDGQTFEMSINGEIESIEVKGEEEEKEQKQGGGQENQ